MLLQRAKTQTTFAYMPIYYLMEMAGHGTKFREDDSCLSSVRAVRSLFVLTLVKLKLSL